MPLPLLLTPALVGYAFGEAGKIRRELRRSIRWIGKKRAHGRGRVIGVDVDAIGEDRSIVCDGAFVRWVPRVGGSRLVRPRPPYWSIIGRVECAEIGEVAEDGEALPRHRREGRPGWPIRVNVRDLRAHGHEAVGLALTAHETFRLRLLARRRVALFVAREVRGRIAERRRPEDQELDPAHAVGVLRLTPAQDDPCYHGPASPGPIEVRI